MTRKAGNGKRRSPDRPARPRAPLRSAPAPDRPTHRGAETDAELLRLGHVVRHAAWGLLVVDARSDRIMIANPAAAELLGYALEELVGTPLAATFPPEQRRELEDPRYRAHQSGDVVFEGERLRKDGSRFVGLSHVTAYRDESGEIGFSSATLEDVTERRRTEAALAASEERYRDLVENSGVLICTHALDGRILSANAQAARALGIPRQELERGNLRDLLAPEARAGYEPYVEALRRDGEARGTMRMVSASGEVRNWQFHNTLRTEGVVEPIVRGTALDITDRRRAESTLLETEARFARLVDNFQGLAYRCRNDPDWTTEFISRGAELLTGYRPEEFVGEGPVRFGQLIHPDDRDRVWNEVQRALERRRPHEIHYRLCHRSGEVRWCWERGCGVYDARGELLFLEGFVTDVSDRERAEEEVRQQVGELRRWYEATLGREDRVQELKREADALRARLGEPPRYPAAAEAGRDPQQEPG